jgi:hypothetical protein
MTLQREVPLTTRVIRTAEYISTVVCYVTSEGGIQFGTNTTPQSHRYTNLHFAQNIIVKAGN